MKFIHQVLFVAGAILISGQFALAQSGITIKGKLMDEAGGEPLSYATVALYNQPDSNMVKGVISEKDGQFKIKDVARARYFLKISFMGYAKRFIRNISISNGKQIYNLGNIQLGKADESLEEVQVKRERLKGKTELDKTVYNLNDDMVAVSSSGLDVLKQIPAVSVDMFDNVTLEGGSNIQFTVNGVIRDRDYVASLNPEQIDKVEVITNPSVKYDASISGVINIMLKKKVNYGVQGQLQADVPAPDAVLINPRANLEYGRENLRLYAHNRMHYEGFNSLQEEVTRQFFTDDTIKQVKTGDGNTEVMRNNLNAGIDWFVNEQNTINLNVNYRYSDMKQKDFSMEQNRWLNGNLQSISDLQMDDLQSSSSMYYSVYWKHDFPQKGRRLLVETGYYDGKKDNIRHFSHTYLDVDTGDPLETVDRNEFITSNNDNIPLRVDYTHTFDKLKLETGYKGRYEWYDNEMRYAKDAAPQSTFQYDEIRHAGYVNFSWKLNKWQFQSGLRGTYSGINMNDGESHSSYLSFLPQVSVMKKMPASQNLRLSYRRRINRPSVQDINPFVRQNDSLHRSIGNPDLDPAYYNKAELSYSKNFKSNYIKPAVFARYTENGFNTINYVNEDGVTVSQTDNIGREWEYGLNMTAALQIAPWLKFNTYSSIYRRMITSESPLSAIDGAQEKWTYRVSGKILANPYKDYNLFFRASYRSPRISYQRTRYRDLMMIGGMQKQILKNLKAGAFMIIPHSDNFTYSKYKVATPTMQREWKGAVKFDFVGVLKLTWSFDYGEKVKKLKRTQENEDKESGGIL